jgi:maleylpyruvate isomerase
LTDIDIDLDAAVAGVAAATKRLIDDLGGLDDTSVRQPSALPGWNNAMVLTHLARNADGYRGLLEGALRGEVVPQYPHGPDGREADIEAGRDRPAILVVEDVIEAAALLAQSYSRMTPEGWRREGEVRSGRIPAWRSVPARRREVEVHRTDLLLGYGPDDWPADFITDELDLAVAALPDRLPPGIAVELTATDGLGEWWSWPSEGSPAQPVPIRASGGQLLAWLLGRPSTVTGGPTLAPWE